MKLKKLLIPAGTIASACAVVVPFTTSCSSQSFVDLTKEYKPTIDCLGEKTLTAKEALKAWYNYSINHPELLEQDYYFSSWDEAVWFTKAMIGDHKQFYGAIDLFKRKVSNVKYEIDTNDNVYLSFTLETQYDRTQTYDRDHLPEGHKIEDLNQYKYREYGVGKFTYEHIPVHIVKSEYAWTEKYVIDVAYQDDDAKLWTADSKMSVSINFTGVETETFNDDTVESYTQKHEYSYAVEKPSQFRTEEDYDFDPIYSYYLKDVTITTE